MIKEPAKKEKEVGWINEYGYEDLSIISKELFELPQYFQMALNNYSMVNFSPIFDAIANIINPKVICEVGVELGLFSDYLFSLSNKYGAKLHLVDPTLSDTTKSSLIFASRDTQLNLHECKSETFLASMPEIDMIFLDGDHNYQTVMAELSLLDKIDDERPVFILLHDVGWPFGKLDLFYDESITSKPLNSSGRLSLFENKSSLKSGLELNIPFAKTQGGKRNGVQEAVDDFLLRSKKQWQYHAFNIFYGLGLLWNKDNYSHEINNSLQRYISAISLSNKIFSVAEINRINLLSKIFSLQKESQLMRGREIALTSHYLESVFSIKPNVANYLTNFSKKYKYIYVETPKVACGTIKGALQCHESGYTYYPTFAEVHLKDKSPLMAPFKNPLAFISVNNDSDTFKFCFVRNPITRILSCYFDKIIGSEYERAIRLPLLGYKTDDELSLLDFLKAISKQKISEMDIHWAPQFYLLNPDKFQYSFIGRFENFSQDFAYCCERIGVASEKALAKNSGKEYKTGANDKVAQYIKEEELKLIISIYEKDFEIFNYPKSIESI